MIKRLSLTLCAIFALLFSAKAANTPPAFTGGHSLSLTVCQNSSATAVNSLLAIRDIDAGQTESWSVSAAALHGTFTASYSAIATGGTLTPSGLTYMPNTGYTGKDTFSVMISDGFAPDITTVYVTVNPLPSAGTITGPATVCTGASIKLTNATTGGGWTSATTNASVSGGTVTGLAAGVATIKYMVINSCGTAVATHNVTVNTTPFAGTITGASSVCIGASIVLTNAEAGGVWSASNAHATVSGGVVAGVSAGMDTISYTVTTACGSSAATKVITINPLADADVISGPSSVCVAATIALTDIVTGGAWSSSDPSATVAGGVVTGVSVGSAVISYTVTTACGTDVAVHTVVINPLPDAGTITTAGLLSMCPASSITLANATPGGVWSASNGNATVDPMGVVTGVTGGLDTIMYSVTTVCGTAVAMETVTVNPGADAGVIKGAAAVCVARTVTLSDAVTGGVWKSSSTGVARVSTAGVVTGVKAGTATISYTVTNACGTDVAELPITVDMPALPLIDTGTRICPFSATALIQLTIGGTWSSSNPLTAFVTGVTDGVGLVLGIVPGTATITYTLNNGCGKTTATKDVTVLTAEECGITIPLGTPTTIVKEGMEITPNPNAGLFKLNVSGRNDEAVLVTITNVMGQRVSSFTATTNTASDVKLELPAGVYFVTAVTATAHYTAQIVIAK